MITLILVYTMEVNLIITIISFLTFIQCVNGLLYPQNNEIRRAYSLDGLWTFVAEPINSPDIGIKNEWFRMDLSAFENATVMPVPSAYNDITMSRILRDHVGWVWYQTIYYPHNHLREHDRFYKIYFESVNYASIVFINGKLVGNHIGGHLPFEFLIHTSTKKLLITVAVNNTLSQKTIPPGHFLYHNGSSNSAYQIPGFDFFHYAGILRPVHIVALPIQRIEQLYLNADVANFGLGTNGILNYKINAITTNLEGYLPHFEIVIRLKHTGEVVVKEISECDSTCFVSGQLQIQNIKKWWPIGYGKSELYNVEVRLQALISNRTKVLDIYRDNIGFRNIFTNESGIYINGKQFYCMGFGMHEDSEIRGRGFDRVVMVKDLNGLEWMNGNCYRTSHYPYSEERAREADRRGIAVITEAPAVGLENFNLWTRNLHAKMIKEMIERDSNRPSVIMWSLANEASTNKPEAAEYFAYLVDLAKSFDTRPITVVINVALQNDKTAALLDVVCLNRYYGWYIILGAVDEINESLYNDVISWKNMHKKPVIITEYGAEAIPGIQEEPSRPFSEQYQIDVLHETHKSFDRLRHEKALAGEMIWNFADFATDNSITRVAGNHKGVFTRDRHPKSSAYMLRRRYGQLRYELLN